MNAPTHTAESHALATLGESTAQLPTVHTSANLVLDPAHMKNMMALAETMARGIATVPKHLQKNAGDCLAVVMQAVQWGMNPFAVAQKTHLVNGTLGYEAQLVNAVVTAKAPIKDRLNYEWFGDWNKVMAKFEERTSKKKVDEDTGQPLKYRVPAWGLKDEEGLGVKVWATIKGEDKPRELVLLLVQCRVRNSPLWADDPRQQIAYLAVKRWTRLHCPDVLLGVYTPDELDSYQGPKDMGAVVPAIPPELLKRATDAADKGKADYAAFWKACTHEERALLDPAGVENNEHDKLKIRAHEADQKRTVDNAPTKPTTAPAAAAATSPEPTPAPTSAPAAAATAADAPAEGGETTVTYAQVASMIARSDNEVALDIADDWIGEVQDPAHRAELTELSKKRRAEFQPQGGAK